MKRNEVELGGHSLFLKGLFHQIPVNGMKAAQCTRLNAGKINIFNNIL
jgi:hypothetical protein